MFDFEKIYAGAVVVGGSVASYLFGGWSTGLQALCILVVVDYITGMTASSLSGRINSQRGYAGIIRKILTFVMIAAAYWAGKVTMGDGTFLRDGAITFYVLNEIISVIENISKCGIPVPDILTRTIETVKNQEKQKEKKKLNANHSTENENKKVM